jgi:hypothetical protein
MTSTNTTVISPVGPNATYADLRSVAYPSIEEQLDMIYHNGLDAWKAEIKTIKDQYPKDDR